MDAQTDYVLSLAKPDHGFDGTGTGAPITPSLPCPTRHMEISAVIDRIHAEREERARAERLRREAKHWALRWAYRPR